jgi:hypothetical protein
MPTNAVRLGPDRQGFTNIGGLVVDCIFFPAAAFGREDSITPMVEIAHLKGRDLDPDPATAGRKVHDLAFLP